MIQIAAKMSKIHTPEQRLEFIDVFRSNATDVSRACKAFGITRNTFYEWYKNDEQFKQAVDHCREEMKDFAESQLYTLMRGKPKIDRDGKLVKWEIRPDTAAIIFYLKTKCKDRGYIERNEIVRPPDDPVTGFDYIIPHDPDDPDPTPVNS